MFRTSTSTATVLHFLIRATASPIDPAMAMWFSFTRAMSYRPNLWFCPPPARTAYFSIALNPGDVFLVSRIFTFVPSTAWTNPRVAVAMPESR